MAAFAACHVAAFSHAPPPHSQAIENPLWDPNSAISVVFFQVDVVLTIAFTLEMVFKMITLGFLLHVNSYLRDAWNVLDFVIVWVSVLSIVASDIPGLKALRALRTLRVLRPLRLINRAPGLKLVVNALLMSIPKIVDVVVVCLLIFLIFAIVGINFLKGQLAGCDGDLSAAEFNFLQTPSWDAISKVDRINLVREQSPFAALGLGSPDWNTYSNPSADAQAHAATGWVSAFSGPAAPASGARFPCTVSQALATCTVTNGVPSCTLTDGGNYPSDVYDATHRPSVTVASAAPQTVDPSTGAVTGCTGGTWVASIAVDGSEVVAVQGTGPWTTNGVACTSVVLHIQASCTPFGSTSSTTFTECDTTRPLEWAGDTELACSTRLGEEPEACLAAGATTPCAAGAYVQGTIAAPSTTCDDTCVLTAAKPLFSFHTSKEACDFLHSMGRDAGWGQTVPQSFDNVGWAMSCLFEMSTTEGWVDIMWAAVDANGIDMQPIRDNTEAWVLFFCFFIVMGSFFVLNLFVGVVCDTFTEMRAQFGGSFLLTDKQKEWVSMRKKINKLGPHIKKFLGKKEPTNKCRLGVYKLVTNKRFEQFIMGCIVFNTLIMALKFFGQPTAWENACIVMNYFFAALFTFECVFKIFGPSALPASPAVPASPASPALLLPACLRCLVATHAAISATALRPTARVQSHLPHTIWAKEPRATLLPLATPLLPLATPCPTVALEPTLLPPERLLSQALASAATSATAGTSSTSSWSSAPTAAS